MLAKIEELEDQDFMDHFRSSIDGDEATLLAEMLYRISLNQKIVGKYIAAALGWSLKRYQIAHSRLRIAYVAANVRFGKAIVEY